MTTLKELKTILGNELVRITNSQLSAEEQAAELRRNHAVNTTAGNIIKIAALSVQVASITVCRENCLRNIVKWRG